MEESVQIWVEIRDSSSRLHRAGVNPGEILKWSRQKTLTEVQLRLHEILCVCEEDKIGNEDDEDLEINNPGDIRNNTAVS